MMKKMLLVLLALSLVAIGCKKANKEFKNVDTKEVGVGNGNLVNGKIVFTMGTDPKDTSIILINGSDTMEKILKRETQHQVTLDPFFMQNTEVTQEAYAKYDSAHKSLNQKGGKYPVDGVTWLDAVKYANWLSENNPDNYGLTPVYTISGNVVTWDKDADGWRLPTEAEWEYAARGNSKGAFSWGNTTDPSKGNFYPGSSTVPVGQYKPNSYGLYDMSGNVFEWVWGKPGTDFTTDPTVNPDTPFDDADPKMETVTITGSGATRGGSWKHQNSDQRIARRGMGTGINSKFDDLGFRLVRNSDGSIV